MAKITTNPDNSSNNKLVVFRCAIYNLHSEIVFGPNGISMSHQFWVKGDRIPRLIPVRILSGIYLEKM